jgi:NADH-quinone oxidoreductase subunit K
MTLTLGHYLTLGAMLFAIAVVGMLLAVNMNFVAFSSYLGDMHGQVFVFFILTVAAAESAIGLAILVLLFRNKTSINAEDLNTLKG